VAGTHDFGVRVAVEFSKRRRPCRNEPVPGHPYCLQHLPPEIARRHTKWVEPNGPGRSRKKASNGPPIMAPKVRPFPSVIWRNLLVLLRQHKIPETDRSAADGPPLVKTKTPG
jgi:hypothetical protein